MADTMMMDNPLRAAGGPRAAGGRRGPPGVTRKRAPMSRPPTHDGAGSVVVAVREPRRSTGSSPPPPPPLSAAPIYVLESAFDDGAPVKGAVRQTGTGASGKGGYVPAYKQAKFSLAVEEPEDSPYMAFQDKLVRHGFVRKVFALLACQLAITIGGVAAMVTSDACVAYVQDTPALFWAAWVVSIVVMGSLLCCDDLRRQFPTNYALLFTFTVAETFLIGVVSSFFNTTVLLLMLSAVAVASLSLMAFAVQTKLDFTMCSGVLLVLSVVLLLFGLSALASPNHIGQLAFAAFGAIMFCCFIVYDTQTVLGGKHRKYQIGPDDYVFAALNLYLDIVTLFVLLLFLCMGRDGR